MLAVPRGTLSTALCLALLLRRRKNWAWLNKALLAVLPALAGRCLMAWYRQLRAYGRHPGTAAARQRCFHRAVRSSDFEERFIGTAADLQPSYDFIVVGSGSAGCACAARLVKTGKSVLLVEAGGEAQRSSMVQRSREAFRCWQSEIDWGFRSTPQKHLLPTGRVLDLERGKTLGGSSCINYNLWVHGAPEDFDRWEKQYGCEGWSYKDVLPHFQCLERVESSTEKRGKEGPIAVAPLFPALPEVEDFMKACEEHGEAHRVADYNAGKLAGVAPVQLCTDGSGGGRQDCFSTLVEPLMSRWPKFQVISESFCRRVLLKENGDTVSCHGVELELRTGEVVSVECEKEVVLSCGALQSPQLLMLSGIGDPQHLAEHGVPCRVALPAVGRNLSDHPILPVMAQMPPGKKFPSRRHNSCGTHGVYFWQSSVGRGREEQLGQKMGSDLETIFNSRIELSLYPKIMVHELSAFLSQLAADARSCLPLRWLSDAALLWGRWKEQRSSWGEDAFSGALELMTILNHPQSRGSVRLRSSDPHVAPVVDPNYMSQKEDVQTLVEAFRRMMRIFQAPAMASYVAAFHPSTPPADASEAEVADYVRRSCRTTWHYSCTTRMGPANKENVCDPQGRVHGVQNLRVADAGSRPDQKRHHVDLTGLMPEVVSGNTHAACVMIGDRIGFFMAETSS